MRDLIAIAEVDPRRARVLLEALHVAYGPQDPAVFHIPEDYRRLVAPKVKRRAP